MKSFFSRGTGAALLAIVLLTGHANAETSLDIHAGGAPFVGAPANTVPVVPSALAAGPNGTLFVADEASGKILRFDPATSTVTSVPNLPGMLEYRFSGLKALGYDTQGLLNLFAGMERWQLDLVDGFRIYLGPMSSIETITFAPDGSMYFTRYSDHSIFRSNTSGNVISGFGSGPGFSGDGTASAQFNTPRGLAFDAAGNIYIADSGNHRVRRRAAATGIVTTVAGTGATNYNGENLLALQTNLSSPSLLAFDSAGNLFIYEAGSRIRKLNAATGRITTVAGDGSSGGIEAVDIEAVGNTLYFAEPYTYRVRKIDASGLVSPVIGNFTPSFCGEGAPALQACLARPNGITIDDAGDVYVSDQGNKRIRKISAASGVITTIAGGISSYPGSDADGIPALDTHFSNGTTGLAVDSARNLYVVVGNRVRRIDAASGIITTIAGTNSASFGGDGGPAIAAQFNGLSRLALDASGNVYVSDTYNNRVRRIDAATGIVTTIAGTGVGNGPLGDGGPATEASLNWPDALVFDPAGNLLISDVYHFSIRRLNLTTGVITTVAGNGAYGFSGNGGPATAAAIGFRPAFSVDEGGNIYLISHVFNQLRRIDAQTGIIDQAPAPIWGLYTPEGRGFESPNDMVLGADNRLYVTDAGVNNLVLRVSGLPTPASDVTPPVIEPNVTGTLGNDGWYRSDVQVTWTIDDAASLLSSTGCEARTITDDTAGTTFSCTATSSGGTTTQSVTIRKDTAAPTISLLHPEAGRNYGAFSATNAQYTCSDTFSTPVSCVGTVPHGSPLPTNSPGAKMFTVTATDAAGNVATLSRNYSVGSMTFEAWVEPLRRSPITNGITAGQLVPIRWRLLDGAGGRVTNPAAFQSLNASVLTCQSAVVPLSGAASGGPGLSVNPSNGVFTYNWQTAAGSTGCRRVILTFADNSSRELWFSF